MARPPFKLEWDAHEYEPKERSQDWFWAVGIITFALAFTSVIFGNVILGILILVAVFSLVVFAKKEPDATHVVIDERGITRGKVLYPFPTLRSFWLELDHPHQKIIIRSEKMLMPYIVIPLAEEVDTDRLRRILLRYMNEEFHSLPLAERLLDYLGF